MLWSPSPELQCLLPWSMRAELHRRIRVSLCEHIIRLISIAQTAGHSLTPAVGGCYKPPPPTAHLSHTHLFSSSTARTLVDFTFRYTRTHTPPLWTTLISRRLHPSQLTALAQGYTSPTAFCFFPPSAFTGHKSYDRAFKRSTSRNPLRSGDVWSRLTVLCFFPPGSEVTTMHNPATWWRRGKRWIKKERDGNKGQFDYSFPFDGLMGARYTNGCLCIPVISCESSACVFPAYRCSLAAHIHWIQPISGRLINEQPPSLPVGLYPSFLPPLSSAFLPLCPLAIVLRPAKPATICRWAVVYTRWNKAMYTPARRPRQESRLHLPYLFFSAPPFCWPAFCYLRKRVLEALYTVRCVLLIHPSAAVSSDQTWDVIWRSKGDYKEAYGWYWAHIHSEICWNGMCLWAVWKLLVRNPLPAI